ncbi:mCG145642, partial [Mus musculus]
VIMGIRFPINVLQHTLNNNIVLCDQLYVYPMPICSVCVCVCVCVRTCTCLLVFPMLRAVVCLSCLPWRQYISLILEVTILCSCLANFSRCVFTLRGFRQVAMISSLLKIIIFANVRVFM